jgi:hypothetical protein
MKPRGSGSDRLLDGERRGKPTIAHADRRDCREGLLLRFRGSCSNFLSNESHHTVRKRRPVECTLNGVPHAFRKVVCSNNCAHAGHAHRFGRVN